MQVDTSAVSYTINDIKDLDDYTTVNTRGQIVITESPEVMTLYNRPITRLNCLLGDHTDRIQITRWGDTIQSIKDKDFYEIHNARIRSFQSDKYLSTNTSSMLKNIDPIPNIVQSLFEETLTSLTITIQTLEGVVGISRYHLC